MWIPSLGWEDSLQVEMTTHSSILAWRIPRVPGVAKSQTQLKRLNTHAPESEVYLISQYPEGEHDCVE